MNKPPDSRRPYIHDGGDEGGRTPDLLTASQALSQLRYAPVTRRYYRGRSMVVQEVFCNCFSNLSVSYSPSAPIKP